MPEVFEVPIYLSRVAIENKLWPLESRRTVRFHYTRFGPIPGLAKEWDEATVRKVPQSDPPGPGCRSVHEACPEPALIVRVPVVSGARIVHEVSSGGVPQTWLRWPGVKRPQDWGAQEVLHAAWMGYRGLSARFAPGSTWTTAEIRAWPRHEQGGPDALPAEEPPPPLIDTAPAPAAPPAEPEPAPVVVQDAAQDRVQVEAPAEPRPKPVIKHVGRGITVEKGPPPKGPIPKRTQMSFLN